MWMLNFAPLPRLPRRGEDHVVLHDGVLGGLVHVEGGELVAQLLQLGEFSRGVAPEKGQRQSRYILQYISLPSDAVRSDSRLLRQVYEGTNFASLKMCGYNGRKWLFRQWF